MKSPVVTYLLLIVLLGLTFGLSYLPLGQVLGTTASLLIAAAKTLLIVRIFMEFGNAGKLSRAWFYTGLAWVAILSTILVDYCTRVWDPRPVSWTGAPEEHVIGTQPNGGAPTPLEDR